MIQVYLCNIEKKITKKRRKDIISFLSVPERREIKKLYNKKILKTFLISRFLLRKVLSQHLKIKPQKINIYFNKYNRPIIFGKLDFNISHSGNWIAIAVNKEGRIGIDIEKKSKINFSDIAQKCFSEKEIKYIMKQKRKSDAFYKIWTLKEAYLKSIGLGFFFDPRKFSLSLGRTIKVAGDKNWKFVTCQFNRNYYFSICFEKNNKVNKPKIINF